MSTTDVSEIVASIEERLGTVRSQLEQAREYTARLAADEAALAKALRALRPEPPKPPKTKTVKKAVSEALIERVREIVAKGPITISDVAVEAGVSTSAVGSALKELRSRQEVRLAGRDGTKRGKPSLFAPMNGEKR